MPKMTEVFLVKLFHDALSQFWWTQHFIVYPEIFSETKQFELYAYLKTSWIERPVSSEISNLAKDYSWQGKRNLWPLRNFGPILVYQLFHFSE